MAFTAMLCPPIAPASPKEAPQTLSATSYTMKDGLPSNQINVVYQDSRGYLWIGTNNGLCMYDGATFTNYSVVQGLTNNWITDVTESRSHPGMMWVGTIAGGVCRFLDGAFVPITRAGGVNVLHEDLRGNLWFVLDDTLYRRHNDTNQTIGTVRPSALGGITDLPDGRVAVGLDRFVFYYAPDGHLIRSRELPLEQGDQIYAMTAARDGGLWIASNGRCVLKLRDTTLISLRCFGADHPFYATEDAEGSLWVRTSAGILEFRGGLVNAGEPRRYVVDDVLPELWAGPIVFDREDNLWVGTWSRGLLKIPDRRLVRIDVHAFADATIDSSGHLWFATDGGVAELSRGGNEGWSLSLHRFSEIPSNPVADQFDRLWSSVLTYPPALYGFEITPVPSAGSRLRPVRRIPLPAKGAWTFCVDRSDRLWMSVEDGSIRIVDLRTAKNVDVVGVGKLPHDRVGVFYPDREGNMWIGFWSRGLAAVPPGGAEHIHVMTTQDGLPYDGIRSICEDREGRLWIGTRHGGLALYRQGTFRSISMNDGLESNSIWQIADDMHNRLWLRTDVGLESIDRTTLQVLPLRAEFRGEKERSFGIFKDDFLWFLSADAVWAFELSRPEGRIASPPVYLKLFSVNDARRPLNDHQEFSYEENNCVMEFVSPSFRDESSVRFQYRMLGVDSSWSAPARQRTVTYASLRPGAYEFEVRAVAPDGVLSSHPATLAFIIRPPFWQSWWFIAAIGLLFLSAGPIVHFRRVAALQRAQESERAFSRQLITSQEQERKRISAELHDSIGQSLLLVKNISDVAQAKGNDPLDRMSEISSIASDALDQVREISYGLRPYQLDSIGLTRTLKSLVSRVSRSTPVQIDLAIDEIDGLFPRDSEIGIFRILQESINNIVKHARATRASITVSKEPSALRITVEDDGRGFSNQAGRQGSGSEGGFGLKGIEERVQMLGGNVAIDSAPEKGTVVHVVIPIQRP